MKRFVSLALALFVACSSPAQRPSPDGSSGTTSAGLVANVDASKPLAAAHNGFGIDLWKQLSQTNTGNLALSPASLSVAFSMTFAGAAGATADEMRNVLGLAGIADPHPGSGALVDLWNTSGKPYALRVANRLFGDKATPFHAAFLDRVKSAYGAPLEPVDFAGAPDPSRLFINDWVAKNTEDRIQDLLPAGSIDDMTRLVLVNAIYFKGQWASRFEKFRTSDGTFTTPAGPAGIGTAKSVPFMRQVGKFEYGETDDATVLQMPYVGDDLAMTFVLPRHSLAAIEPKLSQATLDAWVASLSSGEVNVAIPRFRIATDTLPLKSALEALGMKSAFTQAADFAPMTAAAKLFISDAFHKVFVEVNEEGTEAAAATAVVMAKESAPMRTSFVADKPFLFFVRDLRTGHVLFMGRVTDPAN